MNLGLTADIEGAGRSDPAGDSEPAEKRMSFSGGDCGSLPVTAASVSRHLSVLKEADLIRDRREGKYIYYELNASVLEEVMLWITDLKGESGHEKDDRGE